MVFTAASYTFTATGAVGSNQTASGSIAVTAQYGSGSYTYAWSKVSGYGTIGASTTASANVSLTATVKSSYSGVFQCTVTDAVYGSTMTVQVTVTFDYVSNA